MNVFECVYYLSTILSSVRFLMHSANPLSPSSTSRPQGAQGNSMRDAWPSFRLRPGYVPEPKHIHIKINWLTYTQWKNLKSWIYQPVYTDFKDDAYGFLFLRTWAQQAVDAVRLGQGSPHLPRGPHVGGGSGRVGLRGELGLGIPALNQHLRGTHETHAVQAGKYNWLLHNVLAHRTLQFQLHTLHIGLKKEWGGEGERWAGAEEMAGRDVDVIAVTNTRTGN